jgi:hypothetical protein
MWNVHGGPVRVRRMRRLQRRACPEARRERLATLSLRFYDNGFGAAPSIAAFRGLRVVFLAQDGQAIEPVVPLDIVVSHALDVGIVQPMF